MYWPSQVVAWRMMMVRHGEQRGLGWSTTAACLVWQKRKSLDPFPKLCQHLDEK